MSLAEAGVNRIALKRTIGVDAVTLGCDDGVFCDKLQIERFAPAFEQILERFTHDTFASAARYLAQAV